MKPIIHFFNKKENIVTCCILLSLFVLNVLYRIFVLRQFAFAYTDSDQVVMWCGVRDFSSAQFHEPAYYGQNYNSMLEAALASILFKWVSPVHALPLVTSFLALFPYFLISSISYLKKQRVQACIIASIPLLLPPEYDMMTSMPRGFVTGIFFAAVGSIAVYYPEKKWGFFLFALLSMIGIYLNPNGILMTLPAGILLLFTNYKNRFFYVYALAGAIIGALPILYTRHFYQLHAEYIVHGQWELEFSVEYLKQGFLELDRTFAYVIPGYWYQGWLIFLILITCATILFYQKGRLKAIALYLLFFFLVLILGVNKIYDGDETVFYHYSRMFLALPLSIALFIPFIKIKQWKPVTGITVILAFSFFIYKTQLLEESILTAVRNAENGTITIIKVDELKDDCNRINAVCKQYDVNLVMIVDLWADNFINYGCQACDETFPATLYPKNDRRTWRLQEEKDKVSRTIVLLDKSEQIKSVAEDPAAKDLELVSVGNRMYLLKNNALTTIELIKRLKLKTRVF